METFASYEQEFCKQIQSVQRKLQVLGSQPRERKEAAINEAQQELGEAEKCLRQMEIEMTALGAQQRIAVQKQLRSHRDDFEQLKKDFRKEENNYMEQKNKDTLMGSRLDVGSTHDHRQRLLATNDLLYNQIQKPELAQQKELESEQISIEVENDLHMNNEKIIDPPQSTEKLDDNLGKGNRLIREISARVLSNKKILIVFGIILAVVIASIVYMKFS